jgi:superfamily II DNA or RNA helicase
MHLNQLLANPLTTMSSHDIIDNRQHKLADRITTILSSSEAAHFAVGYFFLSGFEAIAPQLTHIKKLRLLIGNTSNRQTIEQIAQGYRHLELIRNELEDERYPKQTEIDRMAEEGAMHIRSSLSLMEQTDEAEELVKNLIDTIAEGRLEVKIYTKGVLHAKAYIFDYGQIFDSKGKQLGRSEHGIAIVGSSNLSLAGIQHNTELNVVVHDNDNHAELTNWFDELWDESEDFQTLLMQEMKQSWAGRLATPYDVYMKTLYMLVRDRLSETAPEELIIENKIDKQLADFQQIAVDEAVKKIRQYGGVFVSDVVGLGKSFIGAAIIKRFETLEKVRPLIICPPALAAMWERYNEVYQLNARILSLGMLKEDEHGLRALLENEMYRDRDFILIDESHNLRNAGTQRYKVLAEFMSIDRRCCLLTATPRNKSAWDIYHQLKLFHLDDLTQLPIDPPNLKEFFKAVDNGKKQLPDLLSHILIRRTRSHILRFHGYDADTDEKIDPTNFEPYSTGKKKVYVKVGGKKNFFPSRELETIQYNIEDTYQGIYREIRSYLGAGTQKKKTTKKLLTELSYARYGLGNYVRKEWQKEKLYSNLQKAGSNLRGLIRVLLFKRFESSVYAFSQTIDRLITLHANFLAGLSQGQILLGKDLESLTLDSLDGEELDLSIAESELEQRYDLSAFDTELLQNHIQHDLNILQEIKKLVEPITPDRDAKLQTLKTWLNKPEIVGKKQLIFTQYADTAAYLYDNLHEKRDDIDVIYSSSSSRNKLDLVRRFAPKANAKEGKLSRSEIELHTLIATDVLSEGLNLQDGEIIINYDLHWNPVRLIQRFGRIDRIGSENETIYGYNFLPETALDRNLGLKQKLEQRIQEIHETIGEDAAILDRGEQLNKDAMYAIYSKDNSGKQLNIFEEPHALDLTEAESILRQLKNDNPQEFDRLANLPNGLRTSRLSFYKGTYVFCEAIDLHDESHKGYQQLYLLDEHGEIISKDIAQILGHLKCTPDDETALLPHHHNRMVMKVKQEFADEVKHRQSQLDTRTRLSASQSYIIRELKVMYGEKDIDLARQRKIEILEKCFSDRLTPAIRKELDIIRRERLIGEALYDRLVLLYQRYDLAHFTSKIGVETSILMPAIVCSSSLI